MKRVTQEEAARVLAAWGEERSRWTGYDPTGWAATVWIVHAMYEHPKLPSDVTYDDVRRKRRGARVPERLVGKVSVDEILEHATLVGARLGRFGDPGGEWRRLRWRQLGERLGIDPYAGEFPPGGRSFPYRSWPINILPPNEGSLDREQFLRLLDILADESAQGQEESCFAFYSPLAASVDSNQHMLFRCSLGNLADLYDNEDLSGSPTNVWPHDRSWFVYTDWDLWATKVSGSRRLADRIHNDDQLETVLLDF